VWPERGSPTLAPHPQSDESFAYDTVAEVFPWFAAAGPGMQLVLSLFGSLAWTIWKASFGGFQLQELGGNTLLASCVNVASASHLA
ncbi:hypothetical protein AK812_SmicGene47121, partial [Symbiodinium microadriaticum]